VIISGQNLTTRDQIKILGIPVDRVSMSEALAQIKEFLNGSKFNLVITADASGIVQAQDDPEYKQLFFEASLITPDGAGILWAAKLAGTPLKERVSGVDLVSKLCELSAQTGASIYFLGAAPGVAKLAADRLTERFPGCKIVGTRDGYFRPDQDIEVANEISKLGPDILLVAMGIPRQEKFIFKTREIVKPKVAMGIGGSFDVHSGTVTRAPILIQKAKLEWLWRLLLNPKKISKVRLLPVFVRRVIAEQRKN